MDDNNGDFMRQSDIESDDNTVTETESEDGEIVGPGPPGDSSSGADDDDGDGDDDDGDDDDDDDGDSDDNGPRPTQPLLPHPNVVQQKWRPTPVSNNQGLMSNIGVQSMWDRLVSSSFKGGAPNPRQRNRLREGGDVSSSDDGDGGDRIRQRRVEHLQEAQRKAQGVLDLKKPLLHRPSSSSHSHSHRRSSGGSRRLRMLVREQRRRRALRDELVRRKARKLLDVDPSRSYSTLANPMRLNDDTSTNPVIDQLATMMAASKLSSSHQKINPLANALQGTGDANNTHPYGLRLSATQQKRYDQLTRPPKRIFRFNPNRMLTHGAMMFIGHSGTGKSTCMMDILYYMRHKFTQVLAFCGSMESQMEFRRHVPDLFIYDGFNPSVLRLARLTQELASVRGECNPLLIIIDDCSHQKQLYLYNPDFIWFLKNGRKAKCLTMISQQYYTDLTPEFRNQCMYTFIQKEDTKRYLMTLYEQYNNAFDTYDEFNTALEQCTRDFGTMVLSFDPHSTTSDFSSKVFCHRSVFGRKFKVDRNGNMWKYQKRHYDSKKTEARLIDEVRRAKFEFEINPDGTKSRSTGGARGYSNRTSIAPSNALVSPDAYLAYIERQRNQQLGLPDPAPPTQQSMGDGGFQAQQGVDAGLPPGYTRLYKGGPIVVETTRLYEDNPKRHSEIVPF